MQRPAEPGNRASPHDALFRRIMGQPEHAASEMQSLLPPAVAARLQLERLMPVPGSFVDEDLSWRHCDLLFSTRTRGRDAFLYVLVEHQSTPDAWMAWRIQRYVTRIWGRYRVEHPRRPLLPMVLPLVVYHGSTPWPHPTDLYDLLDVDPDLRADPAVEVMIPRLRFLLDDLSRVDVAALRARALTAPARLTLFLLQRAAGNPDLARELADWTSDLRATLDRPDGLETFRSLVTYIHHVGEPPYDDVHRLMEDVGPDAEEAYVTIADVLRAEGEARGRAEALLQLVSLRFGSVSTAVEETVRAASSEQIESWTAKIFAASTVDDVLI